MDNLDDQSGFPEPVHTLRMSSDGQYALAIKGNAIAVYNSPDVADVDSFVDAEKGIEMYGLSSDDGKIIIDENSLHLLILLNSFRHIAPSAHLRQHSSIHIYPAPPRRPPSMTSFLLLPTSSGLPDAKYL